MILTLHEFLAGPGVWIGFTVFALGLIGRSVFLFGLSKGRDQVLYDYLDARWGLKSIFHWLVPLGSVSLRSQPVFGLVVFIFHVCLLGVPLFLSAHNILLEENLGLSLWSMPDHLADWLTVLMVLCGIYLMARRVLRPEVRVLTSCWDHTLIILTMAPFVTGWLAYHQLGDYNLMLVLHLLSAELLLILIPFTKLGHMVLFFYSRFFIGSDMGGRRDIEGRDGARTW